MGIILIISFIHTVQHNSVQASIKIYHDKELKSDVSEFWDKYAGNMIFSPNQVALNLNI